ncbi:MAG: restriction endonuclease subunit S [Opitutaceae bacterium]|nr:restriction endonuclease subunit S [Opitutaceae bacterium]
MKIKHGFAFLGEHFADSGQYILLTPGNVNPGGGLRLKGARETYYSGNFPHEYILSRGDLVVVMTDLTQDASILGGAMLIDRDRVYLHNQRLGLISHSPDIERRFLYFYLNWQYFRDQVKASSNGATVKHTSPGRIYQCKILLPGNKVTQRKIAAVLAGYDDLIETNRRRIALLERMAEELYREWFVRLRFPGHAQTKITKGLPTGWEIRPFSSVVTIDPVERIDKEEERPFVAMDNLSESSMYFRPSDRRKGNVGPKFRNGDVLFPRITPSVENGKRGLVLTLAEGEIAQGSTELIVMREKVITSEHIYFLSCSEGFRTNAELSMTGASGRQRVQDQCFDNFLVKVPPEPLRQRFTEVVRPMVGQIRLLSQQSEQLQRTRDLLLPRLISGKLSVEDLAIAFPPSMAEK